MAKTRALVLGGGGVIGVAWETGVVLGLEEAGFDPRGVDAVVGTSAGAIVGAQIAAGRLPQGAPNPNAPRNATSDPPIDPTKLDPQALSKIFVQWAAMQHTTPAEAAAIGAIARGLLRAGESKWVSSIAQSVGVDDWPERPLWIAAVDTESGERRAFTRNDGAELARAIAASSAVPGLFPSVEIQGRLYMDGQVHSSTNADVLLGHPPDQVLIAMPTNGHTARGIGRHADRMLEREIEQLRQAGVEVQLKTPSAEQAKTLGGNLMDPTHIPEAYQFGLETGRAWAAEIARGA